MRDCNYSYGLVDGCQVRWPWIVWIKGPAVFGEPDMHVIITTSELVEVRHIVGWR